jgi:hypothetical protein
MKRRGTASSFTETAPAGLAMVAAGFLIGIAADLVVSYGGR